jgi:hypothetical protein
MVASQGGGQGGARGDARGAQGGVQPGGEVGGAGETNAIGATDGGAMEQAEGAAEHPVAGLVEEGGPWPWRSTLPDPAG